MSNTLILTRVTCLGIGAAAISVGCYASFEAAAQADGGYLMVAAPVVALAAALFLVFAEVAFHACQYLKGAVLTLVGLFCFVNVVGTAIERNHAAKAGGEAQRAAARAVVTRAAVELTEAKAAAAAATQAANKVRGLEGKACKAACLSVKATEMAAMARVTAAEQALTKADGKAVTEAGFKLPDWWLPVGLELVGAVALWAGFTLGRAPATQAPAEPAPVETVAPLRPKDPRRVAAGRKAAATAARNRAIKAGKLVALAR